MITISWTFPSIYIPHSNLGKMAHKLGFFWYMKDKIRIFITFNMKKNRMANP